MLKYQYMFFLLMIGISAMICLLFLGMRKQRSDSVETAAYDAPPQKKSSLSAAPYRRPQLDTRGLAKLNRDLHKLSASKEKAVKWMLLWTGVIFASMALGALTHNDMVFNCGMLFAIVGIFSYVIGSTAGFHRRLNRTKKQFWGEMAPRLLQQTFSEYGAEVTGGGKERKLSGSFSVEKEKYRAQVQFSALESYVRGTKQKDSYYNIANSLRMCIVPTYNPVPYLDLELIPNDGSFLGKWVQKGSEALSHAVSELRGSTAAREEAELDDPEFRKRFRALSSQSASAEAFLTADRRNAILELSRYLGKMKIRYCDGKIYVSFYGIELAGYAHMSHTGLPFRYTEDHMASLLHDLETALLNLPALWEPLAVNTDSAAE